MTRTTPLIKEISRKPDKPATNYSRLLKILERNAASVQHEPELIRRLRDAIRAIEEKSC